MTAEWIKAISVRNKYKDLNLIEKVIRAMSLLEMLKLSGYPFCFKGGSALMLILGESAHRLSIDIDIICPPGTDIEPYLKDTEKVGFISKALEEQQQRDTNKSLRWGASPYYTKMIGNPTLRNINQNLRNTKFPYDNWRTADPGHIHYKWRLNDEDSWHWFR